MKKQIVSLLDEQIVLLTEKARVDEQTQPGSGMATRRQIAIWVRERNMLAKKADVALIPLTEKDGTGQLIFAEMEEV